MKNLFPRCQILPLADRQVSISVDGVERLRWHGGQHAPRPFFFPFNGPSGISLTRMGHPGAPNHDHHRSVWFAHHKVLGIDFWSDETTATIRQREWLVYDSTDEHAILAVRLGWFDGHDPRELLNQTLMAIVRPGPQAGETLLELQSVFEPTADALEFQKTNFGFMAVRVAASLSEAFGGGRLTSSDGLVGEKDADNRPVIFGSRARWVDYSGPVRPEVVEGLTYFDHPSNPGFPNHWHVRQDGWMGCAPCFAGSLTTTKKAPLRLRWLLHAHAGDCQPERAQQVAEQFATWPLWDVVKGTRPHHQFELREVPRD